MSEDASRPLSSVRTRLDTPSNQAVNTSLTSNLHYHIFAPANILWLEFNRDKK